MMFIPSIKNKLLTLAGAMLISGTCLLANAQQKQFTPGELWPDDKSVHINAHGGGMLYQKGIYYWFGEHKIAGGAGNRAMVGVHCYSSKDL
jgi:hypothetical protein